MLQRIVMAVPEVRAEVSTSFLPVGHARISIGFACPTGNDIVLLPRLGKETPSEVV